MTVAILHHAGDANDPPVRVASTLRLARGLPETVVLCGVDGKHPEARALASALHPRLVFADPYGAIDTLAEVVLTMPRVLGLRATTLCISTEPGHLGRAVLIAHILYWRRGVRIVPWPSAPGAYRSPWRLTVRDVFRALWWRATHR